jgi:hypothetical protein
VLEGRLRYRILDPASEQVLIADRPGLVRPGAAHGVEPLGRVRFFVEFHAAAPVAGEPHRDPVL